MKKIVTLLLVLFAINASAQMKWRLVETVQQKYDYTITALKTTDSTRYYYNYSKDRGGMPGDLFKKYDSLYLFSTSNNNPLAFSKKHIQYFDTNDSILYRLLNDGPSVDSFKYTDSTIRRKFYQYETWGPPTPIWTAYSGDEYVFDSLGNLIVEKELLRMSPPQAGSNFLGLVGAVYHIYDSAGKLVTDSAMHSPYYPMMSKLHNVKYFYDSRDKLIEKHFWVYWVGIGYKLSEVTKYTYENNKLVTDSLWWVDSSNVHLREVHLYDYNNSGLLRTDTTYAKTSNGFEQKKALTYHYTQYGLLSTITEHRDLVIPRNRTIFKYEHYWPAGILPPQRRGPDENVYPNPAQYTYMPIGKKKEWLKAG